MTSEPVERCYLYRFFSTTDELLYVGIARDLGARFSVHRTRSEWWALVASGSTVTYPSRADAELAEAAAIHAEQPLYNIARPSAARITKLSDRALTDGHNVVALVAELERLRAENGRLDIRLVKMGGNLEAARSAYRKMRASWLASETESSAWARKYLDLTNPRPVLPLTTHTPDHDGEGRV